MPSRRCFHGLTASARQILLVVAGCAAFPPIAASQEPEVALHPEPGRLRIELAGRPIATYVYRDEAISRPYFAHVHAADGTRLTRQSPPIAGQDPVDHPTMHPGLWLAFGDLDGADDWRHRAPVVHKRFVEPPAGGPGRGSFAVENRYLTAEGATICRETCRYTILVRPAGILLTSASEFRAEEGEFAFGDQEEMGFGMRVATPISGKQGGRLLNSAGQQGEAQVWGQAADWCDYSGTVDGRRVGLTLMPDPGNFRRSWFHARDYGLLVANPFGRKTFTKGEASRVVVRRGEPFRLGFGVLMHTTPSGEEVDLAGAYQDYLDQLGWGDEAGGRSRPERPR